MLDSAEFLSTIFEYADRGYTQIFTLPNAQGRALPVTDTSSVPQILGEIPAGRETYFSPGISGTAADRKWDIDDIIGIPGFWVDIDIYNPGAHKHANLPQSVGEAMEILPDPIPPSVVVFSGYGIHAWWILKEAWYFDYPEEKTRAQNILVRLQGLIRSRAQAYGWRLDSTGDLPRVMRLPGTMNNKIPGQPVPAQVIEMAEARYSIDDIEEILPETDAADPSGTRERKSAFERRPTDGPAANMLHNCLFLQHAQLNAKSLSYGEWVAALTNIVRATDGVDAAHTVSAIDTARYNQRDTDKKIDECLSNMNPQNCEYIRTTLGFPGCPAGGCGVQAPCGWSLGKVPQAKALIRSITIPTADIVYRQEVLTAAAILEKDAPAEYDVFFQKLTGQVNKNTFRKELAKIRREQSGLTVIDGGLEPDAPAVYDPEAAKWLASKVSDVPLNLQLPGADSNYAQWKFSKSGIGLLRITDKGETFSQAAYSPVVITERIYNVDSGAEKARVAFKTNRGNWRSVILPKSTIFDSKKIMCLADSGLTLNSDMAKNLCKWLSALEAANAQIIPVRDGVSKMGWRSNDTEFILPGLDNRYTIDAGDGAAESAISGLGSDGDFGTWIEAMRGLRTRPKARFIMAASFAAPLLKIVGQRTFLLHNWGNTADGKSATLFAALSIWGKPEEVAKTFDDTRTNIEKAAELFTDLPLGINEYELLSDRKKGEVDPLIYMIAEGKGRGRGRKDGGLQKTAQWRTIAIMTGESPITRTNSRGGVLTRLIELHGGPLADDKAFASSLYWLTARNYGHAGQVFVRQLLAANHAELKTNYDSTRYALRQKYPNKLESHMDAIACIALADWLAGMWIFGEENGQAGAAAIAMADAIIGELISASDADDSERAWTWLQDWVAANDGRFAKGYSQFKSPAPILGYVESGYINIIKTELTNAMKLEGYSPEKLFRSWAEKGRINCSEYSGKRHFGTRGKVINGMKPWVISIKADESLF